MIESLLEPELLLGQVIGASGQAVEQSPRRDEAVVLMSEGRYRQQHEPRHRRRPQPHRLSQCLFSSLLSTENYKR